MSGDYVEHYAVKLFEKWGMGQKDADNGVLLLVSMEEKKIRIEVGYGLEPILTDGRSRYIVQNILQPAFKRGEFSSGVEQAAAAIVQVLETNSGQEAVSKDTNASSPWLSFLSAAWPFIFVFGIIFINWIVAVLSRTKSWWLGGVLGAGFGSVLFLLIGVSIISESIFLVLILLGLVLDYFVSRNYKQHKSNFNQNDPPAWWSGGTWGPGGSSWSSSDSFGGFGGGSSGGGGFSGDW
jgi:uncharacterized protein